MRAERVVLITGPFRSGTSLVAEIVHRLGWQTTAVLPAPAPPAWRSDWEDPVLTMPMLRGWRPGFDWLESYIGTRRVLSRRMGFEGRIALKSGYLALIWETLLRAIGEPAPLVFRTYRSSPERLASLRAHPQLSEKDDDAICRAVYSEVVPSMDVGYEYAVEDPLRCVRAIAKLLGVSDDTSISAAAALVGKPTEYATHALPSRKRE